MINKISLNKFLVLNKNQIKSINFFLITFLPNNNHNNLNYFFLYENFVFNNFYNFKNINNLQYPNNFNLKYSNEQIDNFPTFFKYNNKDYSFMYNFMFLKNSSFINFFLSNMIDVPICFKKSKSLKTKNFELPFLKFSNFLMKKGKKNKTFNVIFNTFRTFFNSIKNYKLKIDENIFSWIKFFTITSNISINFFSDNLQSTFLNLDTPLNLSYLNNFSDTTKFVDVSFFFKNFFYSLLSKVSPIFSYFIYSVDKNIRKYSRGKSGKYTFIWKYVAPYKRIKLSMRWIVKDIKFYQSKKFNDRLFKTFENLLTNYEKSFAWKSKIFSHNYVFKNFKKNLMTSLKTMS